MSLRKYAGDFVVRSTPTDINQLGLGSEPIMVVRRAFPAVAFSIRWPYLPDCPAGIRIASP